jgi:ribonuclease P protein component
MPKHQRLSRADFSLINPARSRRFTGIYFTLSVSKKMAENSANKPKFACVVSKKNAARAVDRNRIRRLCKEAFRAMPGRLNNAETVIFYAKKESKKATFAEVATDIKNLLSHLT